jgi:uncharacterized protein (TIGR00369 family)
MADDLEQLITQMPFAAYLGIALEEASPERVVATLPMASHLCTSTGVMHGGVLMSLADTVGALVVVLSLAQDEVTATLTSTTQMFRPLTAGTIRAVALPLNRGRTTATAQTTLYDPDGKLVSQTTQIQAIRKAPM